MQGKFVFQQLVENFADFQWNSFIIKQNNRAFQKYQPREKFIF